MQSQDRALHCCGSSFPAEMGALPATGTTSAALGRHLLPAEWASGGCAREATGDFRQWPPYTGKAISFLGWVVEILRQMSLRYMDRDSHHGCALNPKIAPSQSFSCRLTIIQATSLHSVTNFFLDLGRRMSYYLWYKVSWAVAGTPAQSNVFS